MYRMPTSLFQKRLPSLPIIFISLFIAAIGIGCGGGGAPAPAPVDQDASGLYNGAGTGTFTGVNSSNEIILTNVKGIIDGTRFMFFNADSSNADSNVLFDGQINSITGTDFVGSATVYQGGRVASTAVQVSGTVNSRSQIQLTFAKASNGNFLSGTVNGTFSDEYDKAATFARVVFNGGNGDWGWLQANSVYMSIDGMTMEELGFSESKKSYSSETSNSDSSEFCTHNGEVDISLSGKNIYNITNEDIIDVIFPGPTTAPCTDLNPTTGYTGFFTAIDGTNTDDTLWYVIANGTYAVFAIVTR